MNASDLKINLIQRITQLKERRIIEEIQKLLDFELDTDEYILTDSQKDRIAEVQRNIRILHFLPMNRPIRI